MPSNTRLSNSPAPTPSSSPRASFRSVLFTEGPLRAVFSVVLLASTDSMVTLGDVDELEVHENVRTMRLDYRGLIRSILLRSRSSRSGS